MTEREWLDAPDPQWLLDHVGQQLSARKVRLFAVACCRTIASILAASQQYALVVAERHADRTATDEEMKAALLNVLLPAADSGHERLPAPVRGHAARSVHAALYCKAYEDLYYADDRMSGPYSLIPYAPQAFDPPANYALFASINVAHTLAAYAGVDRSTASQEELLRNVFSNHASLFRDIVVNPTGDDASRIAGVSRSSPRIKTLAAHIYLTSSFHLVPLLASLLSEAGLDSPAINEHARSDLPHVRGCWLVDLVMGLD